MKPPDSAAKNFMTPTQQDQPTSRTVAVIGGGLAGIAAAEAAARCGDRVDLYEWAQVLGGRLGSMKEPRTGQWIDSGQHILLGCCRETLDLHRRLGLAEFFDRYETMGFVSENGRPWDLSPSSYLPGRWQLLPAFLKIPFLGFSDRISTGLLLRKLGRRPPSSRVPTVVEPSVVFGDWLQTHRASPESIERFWAPLVLSTLSDTVETVSLDAVRKVVRDGLLAGMPAMTAYIPNRPLRFIYGDATREALERLGVRVRLGARVERLLWTNYADDACTRPVDDDNEDEAVTCRISSLETADGRRRKYDRYILAVPSHRAWRLLEDSDLSVFTDMLDLTRFEPGAITSVHFWSNRRILPEGRRHCAVLGGPGQVLFCPAVDEHRDWLTEPGGNGSPGATISSSSGIYHLVVISAAHRLLSDVEMTAVGGRHLLDRVLKQLGNAFPRVFRSGDDPFRVDHWRVTTVFDAVFSPHPEVYSDRPQQRTPIDNLALAGDWTQTDWPATMEGAVLSGLAAVACEPDMA